MRTGLPVVSLAAALSLAGCRSDTAAPEVDSPRPARAAPRADWRAAEATISVDRMRAHVALLSADDLHGRETFTEGAAQAARYIEARFAEYGLEKLPGQRGYQVDYTVDESGWDPAGSLLTWKRAGGKAAAGRALRPGVDFQPLDPTDEGRLIEARVVFAGYGLDLPKKGWNDYAGLDVKGKVVLLLRHVPRENQRKAEAEAAQKTGKGREDERAIGAMDGAFTAKAKAAHARGAVGMIVVTEPSHQFDDDISLVARRRVPPTAEEKAADEKRKAAGDGALVAALKAGRKAARSDRPFVSAIITRAAADERLAGSGKTLAGLQKAVDAGVKPKALRIGTVEVALAARSSEAARKVTAQNVVGFLPGSDPARRDQWVVVGGHYDHVGEGGLDGDRIHNGADDNASGTAGVLEMARAFASLPPSARPARSLVFVAFSAEEMGLLGSDAMLAEGDLPVDKVVFMLNLDMIGRNPDKKVEILGDAFATGVKEITEKANVGLDVDFEWSGLNYSASSDHHSFFRRHVPSMFFFTGLHDDYHQPGDHADKLAYDRMAALARLGYRIVGEVASAGAAPRFVHQFLWLGATVEMVAGAATVTSLAAGSRGEEAGLRVGDVIVAIAGKRIASSRQLGDAFDALEPGSKAAVSVRRGNATAELTIARARHGYLGIMPGELADEQRKALGLPAEEGLLVQSVTPDGPAAKSGMKEGDVLVRLGGQAVGDRSLFLRLATLGAGERVVAVVVRSGKRVELDLTLGERPRGH
ncbi:MAG TPA: M20/M25/M40 family metallo-hydrolase [Kofleriaceae bacterium]|nr:M20/M25/M40 family metallo-hydrolase [Kofleriaceae bacterium]